VKAVAAPTIQVRVANGGVLVCDTQV
jgi:hypothetical protein